MLTKGILLFDLSVHTQRVPCFMVVTKVRILKESHLSVSVRGGISSARRRNAGTQNLSNSGTFFLSDDGEETYQLVQRSGRLSSNARVLSVRYPRQVSVGWSAHFPSSRHAGSKSGPILRCCGDLKTSLCTSRLCSLLNRCARSWV